MSDGPVIGELSVSAHHVFNGQSIELGWTVRGHDRLVLETPWHEVYEIGDGAPNQLTLTPVRSGAYVLRATNYFGEAVATTGPVFIYTPPQVGFVDVPDLSGVKYVVQPMDPDTMRDIVALAEGSSDLWRGLAAAMPTAAIPVESLVSVKTPALAPPLVDWSELSHVIDESFKSGDRAARNHIAGRRWWRFWESSRQNG